MGEISRGAGISSIRGGDFQIGANGVSDPQSSGISIVDIAASANVLDSDGNSFAVSNTVLNSSGSSFIVEHTVLDSDGNSFQIFN